MLLSDLSEDSPRRGLELTSESSSGVDEEAASTMLTASADQRSKAVEFSVSLVSPINCSMTVPSEFKSAEVCSPTPGAIVGSKKHTISSGVLLEWIPHQF